MQLQRQLGLSYETAWALLHKLRKAMVNPEREALKDKVEVDEMYLGGPEAGLKAAANSSRRRWWWARSKCAVRPPGACAAKPCRMRPRAR